MDNVVLLAADVNAGEVFVKVFTSLGAAVILPFVFFIIGVCLKLKVRDAIVAGMTLGIGFIGMGMLISFMFGYMQDTMDRFNQLTNMNLKGIDLGWSPLAAISWAFMWGLLMFPIQITINIIMLATKTTKTLNLDLWNIWNKIFTAIIVQTILRWAGMSIYAAIPISLIFGSIQIPFELINADVTQKQIFKITKIPGVSCPHQMNFFCAVVWPVEYLLRKSHRLNKQIDAQMLKQKLGIFANNGFIGLVIGFVIGLIAYWPKKGEEVIIYQALIVAIQTATALVLFPMIAKLFMQALAPISTAVDKLMKKKYHNREIYIGLDWPFLAGSQELWTAMIMWVPFTLIYSVGIAYGLNATDTKLSPLLPLATMINVQLGPSVLIATGGNLIRMVILGLIYQPLFLLFGAWLGPVVTEYLNQNPELINSIIKDPSMQEQIKNGTLNISAAGIEAIWYRFSLAYLSLISIPHAVDPILGIKLPWLIGITFFTVWIVLFVWWAKSIQKISDNVCLELNIWTEEELRIEQTKRKMRFNWVRKLSKKDLIAIDGFTSVKQYEQSILKEVTNNENAS